MGSVGPGRQIRRARLNLFKGEIITKLASTPSPFTGSVAVVAFQTGRGHQVYRMTVCAGGTMVLQAIAFPATWMGLVEAGRGPGVGIVALVAGCIFE